MGADAGVPALIPVLFHPDYTVGPGITPDLLTPWTTWSKGARGLEHRCLYRRWGIAPRPENYAELSSRDDEHRGGDCTGQVRTGVYLCALSEQCGKSVRANAPSGDAGSGHNRTSLDSNLLLTAKNFVIGA